MDVERRGRCMGTYPPLPRVALGTWWGLSISPYYTDGEFKG